MNTNTHHHIYDTNVSDWWCLDCDTVTDYCTGDVGEVEDLDMAVALNAMPRQSDGRNTVVLQDGTRLTVSDVRRHNGIAGQVSVTSRVDYAFTGGATDHTTREFVGSVYGGPVVLIFGDGEQVFIRNPERFGSFAADPAEWARRFNLGIE